MNTEHKNSLLLPREGWKQHRISLTLKLVYLTFMAILIPTYWVHYGPANFLWISDVTLILAFLAVLFESKVFASMAAVGGFVLESYWTVSFVLALGFNIHFTDIADYMFNASLPLWLRLLSLFHIVLPILVIWLVRQLGYYKKAVWIQIVLTCAVLSICWLFTKPSENINWVFSYQNLQMNPVLYLILECLGAACILFITHVFLSKISRKNP